MEHNHTILILLTVCIFSCIYCIPAKKDGVDNGKTRRTLAKYFSTYGYTSSYTENVNDIRASIKNFQDFAGLKPTGQLDKSTFELLQTDRCGMKDPIKDKRMRRYVRQGSRWEKKPGHNVAIITWQYEHNANYENPRRLGREPILSVMKRAMSLWEAQTNIRFVEVDTSKPDVWVKFANRRHEDPWAFDGTGGTLAHAFYPHKQNKGLAGDVHFDDDEYFFIEKKNYGTSLYWVAVHELGHTLGLEHSSTQSAVMAPFYRGYRDVELDDDDIKGIKHIYGVKNKSEKPDKKDKSRPEKPDKEIPLNKRCPAGKVTAMFDSKNGKDYMVMTEDERLYVVDKNGGGIKQADMDAKSYFRTARKMISGRIDAVLQTSLKDNIVFAGKNFYRYRGHRFISGPHPLKKYGLPDHLERIDGAMKWWPNNKIYFFSGEDYWRFNEATQKVDPGYPKKIESQWHLPGKVDSAFCSYETKETIFTIGDRIYRVQERPYPARVKSGYPRNIKTDLLDCKDV